MAPPRASRSRMIVDSDDEEDSPRKTKSKQNSLPSTTYDSLIQTDSSPLKLASQSSTPAQTPQKSKTVDKKGKGKASNKTTKGTISSFFSAATQLSNAKLITAPAPILFLEEEAFDDIEDTDDGPTHNRTGSVAPTVPSSGNPFVSKKRGSDEMSRSSNGVTKSITQGVGKFLKRYDGARVTSPVPCLKPVPEHDPRPWTEKYAPQSLEELVVHKRKVSDVRQWLSGSLGGDKHKKLLILRGAAGSGKTTTISMLSKALDYDIKEWRNPGMADVSSGDYASVLSQFEDFVGRERRFGMLDLVSTHNGQEDKDPSPGQEKASSDNKAQALLVEEFPNNVTGNTLASQAFRSSILQVLSAPTNPAVRPTPLVMIISESVLSNSASSFDNYTAHRLLGPEILHHPSTTVIEFNAVAPTYITKALSLVLQKRSREARQYYSPHADVIKKLAEFGDVRNATSTLEFLCLQKGDDICLDKFPPTKGKSRQFSTKPTSSKGNDSDFALIALRESSIGLFHAVGKVVYSKRASNDHLISSMATAGETQLQDHLSHHKRPMVSEVDPDTLIDETGTDVSTFISALHENYLLSCRSPNGNIEADLDLTNGCLDALCDADILSNVVGTRAGQYSGASEGLRQSELAFQIGVSGLLFTLQHPVKREAPPGRSKAEAQRMFYPASLKLWRKREEMYDLIELVTTRALNGRLLAGLHLRSHSTPQHVPSKPSEDATISIGSGQSPLQEMLLERLPYLVHLLARDQPAESIRSLKQIQQITRFTGIRVLQDDDEYDEQSSVFDNGPNPEDVARRGLGFLTGSSHGNVTTDDELSVQKLVLIDDDIEDD